MSRTHPQTKQKSIFTTNLKRALDYSDKIETRPASTFGELDYYFDFFHLESCDRRNLFSAMSLLDGLQAALVRGYRTSALARGGGHGHEGYVSVV